MLIEAGKYYRTRGGQKAYVAASAETLEKGNETIDDGYYIIGWVLDKNKWREGGWFKEGSYMAIESGSDIISEWTEPTLLIKANTYYKREDGRIAYVTSIGSPFENTDIGSVVQGYLESGNSWTWNTEGIYAIGAGEGYNLVEEIDNPSGVVPGEAC